MKKVINYANASRIFPDTFGILCVECPKCEEFIPNVQPGLILKCPQCQYQFKVIE